MIKYTNVGRRPARRGRRARLLIGAAAGCLLLATLGAPAGAVHDDNLFELGPGVASDEGGLTNILGDGILANGPDWADIFDAGGNTVGLFGGVAASFIMDDNSLKGAVDRTTFSGAGGSNKNNDAISGAGDTWHWDSGNVPAKDDLTNLYAYATNNPANGDLVLYSGFERVDPSGDSHLDIEFFQDDVALDEAVPCNDPGNDPTPCAFTGTRTIDDFIVSMDFETGGTIGTVSFRRWDGTEYVLVEELTTGEGCDATDTICAFNNGGTINGGPWPNIDRTGNVVTTLEQNAFTEFGIDLTALLGSTPCVSTFMGKTRSSSSFTAELKDFGGPSAFNVCADKTGVKFHDLNGNGVKDAAEPGLEGWTINLYNDTDPVGSYNGEGLARPAATTGPDGSYSFEDLFSGNYIVCEELQAGWTQSFPNSGTTLPAGETLVINCPGNTTGYAFAMSGDNRANNDFGNFQAGTVSGMKFKDVADNGAKDPGDPGLAGWEIHLFGTDGLGNLVHQHTTTAADGTYSFTVNPGSYTVCESLQANWVESFPTSGADCSAHSDTAGANVGYSVTVSSGDTTTNVNKDFGNSPLSNITVTFNSLVSGMTEATSISCVSGTTNVGSTDTDSLTTSNLRVRQSPVVCTITYIDP